MNACDYILIAVPHCLKLSVKYPPEIKIKVSCLTGEQRSGGGGGGEPSSRMIQPFSNADLVDGVLRVAHNLNLSAVDVSVISPSLGEVNADSIVYESSSVVRISLKSYLPISGFWQVLVEA